MFGWNSLDSRDTIFVLNLPLGGESGSGNQPLLTPNGLGFLTKFLSLILS